jgi:4'-phosphopantetheinyl transferase
MSTEDLPADYKFILKGEIDVWKISNFIDSKALDSCEGGRGEQGWANENRKRSAAKRNAICLLAAKYAREDPSFFSIGVGPFGKPYFANEPSLHFSLSDCGGDVAVAFSESPVGFDLEKKDRLVNSNALAKRFFSPEEALKIEQAGGEGRGVFLEHWTAKEAMLKLAGTGLGGGLDRAVVAEGGEGRLDGRRVYLHRLDWPEHHAVVATFADLLTVQDRGIFIG